MSSVRRSAAPIRPVVTRRWAMRVGVNLEVLAFKGSGVVLALVRDRGFVASGLGAFATGSFASGTVEWTSGANAGRRAEVMMHEIAATEVSITLMEMPVRALATGDAFVIRAGCDKRLETCRDRFANALNFRGFPNIPGQDAVLRYAASGDANQGVVL